VTRAVRRRAAGPGSGPRWLAAGPGAGQPDQAAEPAPGVRQAQQPAARPGLIIVLSYLHSGADAAQAALAADDDLACTSGTGILPLCAAAAESWRRIEARQEPGLSRLAAATIRGLVTAQVTAILAKSGQHRWCELAAASSGAADAFLRVFPDTQLVCVHRSCLDVVGSAVRASPWGLQAQVFVPYLLGYAGNNVAAMAAYWADSTEQLLSFERANPAACHRLRYEDVTSEQGDALALLRAALRLAGHGPHGARQDGAQSPGMRAADAEIGQAAGAPVPLQLIPEPLRKRINGLHAELGYKPLTYL
jgi:Sulfotransferase family